MLTPSDKYKIENFNKLNKNHQRVFKHRLIKKCLSAIEDFKFVLLSYENVNLKVDKIFNIKNMEDLLKIYENIKKLQTM